MAITATHQPADHGPSGDADLEWAARMMPLLAATMEDVGDAFEGLKVGICLHVEPKTAVLCRLLSRYGAQVTITGNAGTTDPTTARALVALGIDVIGGRDDTPRQHQSNLDAVINSAPDLVLDNGADLIERLVRAPRGVGALRGATEETTTGGLRIRSMGHPPGFPVIVINDSPLKLLVENEFGVGQSIVQGYMNATNSMLPSTRATVVGYGPCGKGVAQTLAQLGARVSVAELNPLRALEALMDGHAVGPLEELLPTTAALFLATGAPAVIGAAELARIADGAVIAGVGHEARELDENALERVTESVVNLSPAGADVDARLLHRLTDGRGIVVLHRTKMVNLVAARGNPIQAMDLGLALQAASLAELARGDEGMRGVMAVPDAINHRLAASLVEILR